MAVRIIKGDGESCLWDSVTGQAFGPVHCSIDFDLEDFVNEQEHAGVKLHHLEPAELDRRYFAWIEKQREKEFDAEIDL